MTASSGNLDSLVNLSFPVEDYGGLAEHSYTASTNGFTPVLSTLTGTTTGAAGPFAVSGSGETIRIAAVNDSLNSLTFTISAGGTNLQETVYALGFATNGILVGTLSSTDLAEFLQGGQNVDSLIGVIATAPLATGTSFAFSSTGSFTGSSTPPPPPPTPGLGVLDTTTGQTVSAVATTYTGPVSGLQEQYINVTTDNLNISVSTPNWFIHSGSGEDALAVNSGINVLDGGTGSNFLTGGSGTDTFFVDDRGPAADIWSTVVNFHAGDAATIWGVTPSDFTLSWADGQGAAGFTGLTVHATAAGKPTASLTLAGFTQADMASGRVSVSFGNDPASGSAYMYVHANS